MHVARYCSRDRASQDSLNKSLLRALNNYKTYITINYPLKKQILVTQQNSITYTKNKSLLIIYYMYLYLKQYKYNVKSTTQSTLCAFDTDESHIFHSSAMPQRSHFYSYVVTVKYRKRYVWNCSFVKVMVKWVMKSATTISLLLVTCELNRQWRHPLPKTCIREKALLTTTSTTHNHLFCV